ncbi:MAG: DUF1553 domain-containing protein [Planctomycetales bacterium]|nr:DUF1553 domain-containing protein [Planctomycetales bacterium]
MRNLRPFLFCVLTFWSCTFITGILCVANEVEFSRDIRPILSDACFQCHGPDEEHREGDLRFDDKESVLENRGDYAVVKPLARNESELWKRIVSDDPDLQMPPPDQTKQLTAQQIELLGKWIDEGAEFQGHWAFVTPQRPAPPEVDDLRFSRTAIDRFIYSAMRAKGLSPAPQSPNEILLRRISLDITGLPPTVEEVEAFLADGSNNALENAIDRLLQSPHFGERMALDWMDAARYGDSSVFHADGPRDMWVWREWVIDAFNQNMPFDQFTVEQLAGDLLPKPTWRQMVATGFNRNNATTDEGGLIEEEYRVEYAVDRVKTTSMVWLGLSMECGQCHDHKYDPISQEDYYRFFAFFNQAADPGKQTRNGNQTPIVEVPDESKTAQIPELEQKLADFKATLATIRTDAKNDFQTWKTTQLASLQPVAAIEGEVAHFPLDSVDDGKSTNVAGESTFAAISGDDREKEPIVDGQLVNAFSTNGKRFAEVEGLADFERDQAFSYGCWIRAPKVEGAPIAKMDTDAASRGFDLHLGPNNIAAHLINKWPDNAVKVEAQREFKPNQWYHVFVTYNGSSKADGVQIYVDGTQLKTKAVADKLSDTIRVDKPLTIGRRSTGSIFNGSIDDVRIFNRELSIDEVNALASADSAAALLQVADRSETQEDRLYNLYLTNHNQSYGKALKDIQATETMISVYKKPRSTVMVMKNLPTMRTTYVLNRGQYDSPDMERPVEPGIPSFLPEFEVDQSATRLDLANWIVSQQNPLTARVIVNRYWRLLMGTGIVKTVEEFGSQGDWPTHPRLLDWLAVDFMENGWNVKRLLKQIMMSETYQQSARSTPEQLAVDPDNRYLSHGPRFRLQGEFIRDHALAVSGLLVKDIGGPSVKPYQPPGIWNEVSLDGNLRYKQDSGHNLYRRSMYTYWKRSAPSPSMTIFDAPTREKCTVRRSTTNTPLQALVVMNDPQFIEASRFLAERVMKGAESIDDRIELAYRIATARRPSQRTAEILRNAYETELDAFKKDNERANKLLAQGEGKRDASLDPAEHAAWTIVSSIILNLDETLTRG